MKDPVKHAIFLGLDIVIQDDMVFTDVMANKTVFLFLIFPPRYFIVSKSPAFLFYHLRISELLKISQCTLELIDFMCKVSNLILEILKGYPKITIIEPRNLFPKRPNILHLRQTTCH